MQNVIGSIAMPASRAPYPATVCSWSTTKKVTAPSAAYTTRVIALAALKVRSRKRTSGSIGYRLRDSTSRNPSAARTPTTAATVAASDPHSIREYVAPPSASVASVAPVTSKCGEASGSEVSGTSRVAITTVTTASGTLTRKIQRQLAYSTSAPPTNGPTAEAIPPRPDQAPIARPRSSTTKAPWIMARLPGMSSAPPTPWTTRAAISSWGPGASPQRTEASAKTTVPTTKIRRRPKRSPSEPPSRIREESESR